MKSSRKIKEEHRFLKNMTCLTEENGIGYGKCGYGGSMSVGP